MIVICTEQKVESMSKKLRPLATVSGEGIKIHEAFKFKVESGKSNWFRVHPAFAPVVDGFQPIEFELKE